MPEANLDKLPHAKSYTSIYDIFGAMSYGNVFHIGLNKTNKDQSVVHTSYGESANQSLECDYPVTNTTNYVTSEKYHALNHDISSKTVAPSTSTLFYDLDDIAKRHSFHCLTELSMSNSNVMKVMKMPGLPFGGKTSAIVQECATQIHPKLLPRDSRELNAKKVKKQMSKDLTLSSEIFLRDDNYFPEYQRNNHHYKDIPDRHQKFWSYAKYRTEYTKPIPEEKKSRKKDRGKRTEDPCPCQLFSYACPCTDKKSLTELARNSKSLTVVDQRTSTTQANSDEKKDSKSHKTKKHKREPVKEDKPTNTSVVEMIEVIVPKMEPTTPVTNKQDVPVLSDKNTANKKPKSKSRKKPRRVLCPNCKEKVDVVISISTTEEEESLKYEHSSIYRSKEIPSTTAYAYRASPNSHRSKNMEDGDLCLHEPRCELLPVCQILPTENVYNVNQKCANKKHSAPKSTPRIIRITKACRHHPPCTVVPSCQRANVLKNNCEYIPPCLHRPRCVNLPLCVPFSKSLHYEEATNKLVDDMETSDCPHIPRCKFIPMCHHDSLAHVTNTVDQQINMVSRVQNGCEFLTDYNNPAYMINPKTTCTANTFSPCQFTPCSPNPLCYTEQYTCRSNKSCQFDCSHCKCANESKDDPSDEAVVFIRDVGCQFRNKGYSPKESVLQSKVSSNSFDFVDVKMANYYANVHTLRYEDKYTSPLSGEELSFSTGSITSMELDSECPSHGRRTNRTSRRVRPTTGFIPKSAYVTAFSTVTNPVPIKCDASKTVIQDFHDGRNAFPVKSRRSFLKGKYRKMFSVKRRRKSRISTHVFNCGSEKLVPKQSQ